jgi:hypothetical protein
MIQCELFVNCQRAVTSLLQFPELERPDRDPYEPEDLDV